MNWNPFMTHFSFASLALTGERIMSATPRIPDVALINLSFLLALKEAVSRNPAQACCRFNLNPSDVAVIKELGVDAIEALSLDINEPLVMLRYTGEDLVALIKTPPGLRAVFTAVRDHVEPVDSRTPRKPSSPPAKTRDPRAM